MIARLLFLVCLFAGTAAAQLAPPRKDIPAIAKAANGSIVSIVISDKDGKPIAQGSGFLVSTDGVIVTNYHVISEGSSAIVKFPDGAFYVVDGVLAFDKARDVAVIKAHGENFRALTLGNSDRLQVGEEVVAIGNPLSLESTVSNGIVSGIRTVKEKGGKFLQVTTPISPGSSGGPLFNMAGAVVGITTLYIEGGENLNFAIPINDAKELVMLSLSTDSKVHDFPNETKSVQPQTPDAAPASVQPQTPNTTLPDAAKALNWISGHMLSRALHTMPGVNGTTVQAWETSSLSFQGCRVTLYDETIMSTVFKSGEEYGSGPTTITWGPFDLSNLRPDEIFQVPDKIWQPPGAFLQIEAVNAIPVVQINSSGPTTSSMLSGLHIWFDSAELVDRQVKAWHDAIVGCGGKKTQDDLY
jgi:Trypsin-like peptidase domain